MTLLHVDLKARL